LILHEGTTAISSGNYVNVEVLHLGDSACRSQYQEELTNQRNSTH